MNNKKIWKEYYWKQTKLAIKIAGYILFFSIAFFLILISFINIYEHLVIK